MVNVSVDCAVIKTISSDVVSGSIATVNWLPVPMVTPLVSEDPVPAATVIEVAVDEIPEASVVSTLVLENRRVISIP
jgi:hypothetical protein